MPNVTISISKDLQDRMRKVDWVSWSAVCRIAIETILKNIETTEELTQRFSKEIH